MTEENPEFWHIPSNDRRKPKICPTSAAIDLLFFIFVVVVVVVVVVVILLLPAF
jgi:hypothetical protein